jgi:hypothetical protein
MKHLSSAPDPHLAWEKALRIHRVPYHKTSGMLFTVISVARLC